MEYEVGNLVMFRKEQEETGDQKGPGGDWRGPARITGFDNKTVNLTLGLLLVTSSIHKLRPLSFAEMMAYILSQRDGRPVQQVPIVGANQQWQGLDARGPAGLTNESRAVRRRSSSPTPTRGRSTESVPNSSPPRKSLKHIGKTQTADQDVPLPASSSSSTQQDKSQLERLLDEASEPSRNPGRKLA